MPKALKLPHSVQLCLSILCLGLLGGCAVTPAEVNKTKDKVNQEAEQAVRAGKTQLQREARMTYIKGNYLGDKPIDLPYAAGLPSSFFETISLQSRGVGFGSVAQAARNIYLATGIPVRINPDVELIAMPAAGGQGAGAAAAAAPTPKDANEPPSASVVPMNNRLQVRLDFTGTLHAYVKEVANAAGVEWEYKDGAIYFYRLLTKTFNLSNISPGDVDLNDSMSKGGQASTGQTGAANSGSTGSFSSNASVGIRVAYSFWKLLKPMLESASSSLGKVTMNESTGGVTVTDTRDALNKIERIIQNETSVLGQQVIIDVRILRVNLDKISEAGFDLTSVYKVLSADGIDNSSFNVTAPATRTTSVAGNLTFSMNNALSRFNGSKFVVQGLNQFGTVVGDSSTSVITTNRVPAMTGSFKTVGFLAQTVSVPSTVAGGTSTPGLLPGSITTGSFLRILPTIRENNTILINMSVDISDLVDIGSASTGSGSSLQQIQWANTTGTKSIGNLLLNQEESMVIVGSSGENATARTNNGIGGASTSVANTQSLFVVIVTPRILKSL
jgi:type IVB pilus formation R64 PilN family outer membrane protein